MRELKLFNEAEDMRGFHPHITIANRDLKNLTFMRYSPFYTNRSLGVRLHVRLFPLLKTWHKWRVIQ